MPKIIPNHQFTTHNHEIISKKSNTCGCR